MRFTINGNPVTKKNSQQILVNRATGRPFISPSKKYKEYEANAIADLMEQGVKNFTDFDFPIDVPVNYYPDDDPSNIPTLSWRSSSNCIYTNWLNFVYQETPYDLYKIPPLEEASYTLTDPENGN